MASCEEEQEKTKAAEGLKLRLELEKKHTISCHDLIESGLEIERIYSFLLEELMEVEADKMKEMERRVSTSQEHTRMLVSRRSSLLASPVGGANSSTMQDEVVVIQDDTRTPVAEPLAPVTTPTQSPSKSQLPKMKNFSLIISKTKTKKATSEGSDASSQRHQVCSPQQQEASSPVQQKKSPKQSRVQNQSRKVEIEIEINVTSDSEAATSPEIPMQNMDDSLLHIRPRKIINRRLLGETDEEASFVKESPRKLTSGSKTHRSDYSSFGGFKSCSVEKERVLFSPSLPTKKLRSLDKDKVAIKHVTQPVNIVEETTTESYSEQDESVILPKRKRKNRLTTLEDSVRTSPLQKTRAHQKQEEEEEEEAFDMNPQSPKPRLLGKDKVISSQRTVKPSSPTKKHRPHVKKIAKESETTTESSSEKEETVILPKRKRKNRLTTLEDSVRTSPLQKARAHRKQEEEEAFDTKPPQSSKPRLLGKERVISSPKIVKPSSPTKKRQPHDKAVVKKTAKVSETTKSSSETVVLPKRKRRNLLVSLEDSVRTISFQKTSNSKKQDEEVEDQNEEEEEQAFDVNPQSPKPRKPRLLGKERVVSSPKKKKKQVKGKVVTSKAPQPVKTAEETITESFSEKEETVVLPNRKRRNLLSSLEDSIRTSPLQKTRAHASNASKKQEEEKTVNLKPESPKKSALPKRKTRRNKATEDEKSLATEPALPVRQRETSPSAVRLNLRSQRTKQEKEQGSEKERRKELNGPESLSAAEPRLQHQRENEDGREISKPVAASSPLSLRRRKSRSPKQIRREDKELSQKGEEEVESLTLANTIMLLSPLRERMLKARKEETDNEKRCTKVAEKSVVEVESSKRRKNKNKQEEPSELRSLRKRRDPKTLPAAAEQPASQVSSQVEERSKDERIIMLRPPRQIPTRLTKAAVATNTLLDHTAASSISFAKGRRTLLSSTQASCIMDSMMSTFCEQDIEQSKTRRPTLRVNTKGFTTPHLKLSQREKSK